MTETEMMLVGRLDNWKFASASMYLEGQPEKVQNLVRSLSKVFGNCGWFDGDMGYILYGIVERLCREIEERSVK